MPPKRLGRPTKCVHGRDGKKIEGLSFHKSTGTYYATYSQPRVYFGKDFDRALIEFRAWESREKGITVTITHPRDLQVVDALQDDEQDGITLALPPDATFDGDDAVEWIKNNQDRLPEHVRQRLASGKGGTLFIDRRAWELPEDLIASLLRDILTDPIKQVYWGEKTGLPLDRLHHFTAPGPSLTLKVIGEWYENRKRQVTMQTRSDIKRYWNKFRKTVQVETIAEITPEHIQDYNAKLHETFKRKHRSPAWLNNQFAVVRGVFANAIKRGQDTDNLQRVLTLLGILERVDKQKTNSQPISPQHFQKWYDAAGTKYKAILLLMLNAAMRPQDIADLRMENPDGSKILDLEAGELVTYRKKRGQVVRCCILWPRTIKAIQEYLAEEPHDQPTVFVNEIGTPFASGRIVGNNLRNIRDLTDLPKTVKAEHIRDGAYTAAVAAKVDLLQVKILCGHKVGIPDSYIKRGAYMVADACAAIERHYFPSQQGQAEVEKAGGGDGSAKVSVGSSATALSQPEDSRS